ncbi:MAG: hypothetical protein HYU53_10210 [Acidobacteria bacterium]|nr:hypothetical protein [Acidobacteriota bacterium]
MEMFLMALALSLLGVTVSAVLFAAATRQEPREGEPAVDRPVLVPPRFFGDQQEAGVGRVPAEALLLEIERHVRLEQAAAESFLRAPTAESLHSPTVSRLVH